MGRGFTWNTFSPWVWREARGQMCMEVTDQEDEGSAWWPAWSPWQEPGGEFLICHEGGEGICESGGSGRKETVQNLMSKDLEKRSVVGRVELKYPLQGFNFPRPFPTLPSYCRKAPDLRQGSQVRTEWFLAGSIRTISSLSPWPLTFPLSPWRQPEWVLWCMWTHFPKEAVSESQLIPSQCHQEVSPSPAASGTRKTLLGPGNQSVPMHAGWGPSLTDPFLVF